MAMACFRFFTLPPLPPFPDRKVPFFLRCIALFTDLPAARPYLAIAASWAAIFVTKLDALAVKMLRLVHRADQGV
jgi:hypothetical protein